MYQKRPRFGERSRRLETIMAAAARSVCGALRPIDGIAGATTADDILNRIFSTFCIGK